MLKVKATEYEAMFNAEQTHWWYNNLRDEVIGWVERAQAANLGAKQTKLLDLGCGTGGMLQRLQERFKNIRAYGMDYYAPALDFAKLKTSYPLLRGDVKRIPFGDDTFDIILCLDVLYTKEAYPGFQSTLDSVYRLLTENGAFILQLPAFKFLRSQHDVNVHGVHRFTANEICEGLQKAGFSHFKVYYRYNLLLGIACFARRLVLKSKQESHLMVPGVLINSLLYKYFRLESWLNKRVYIPFGVSVFAVAFKRGS